MKTTPVIPARTCGVLLPVHSLPSPHGIGTFGESARAFIDFLDRAHQAYWQVLPLGPTGFGDSPYQSFSAFAGNPYFIDLDILCAQELLTREEINAYPWKGSPDAVDYDLVNKSRGELLYKAFARFHDQAALDAFQEEHAAWLNDYALYMAIKETQGHLPWPQWDLPLRLREADALAQAAGELSVQIRYYVFVQYQFYKQWNELRQYARGKNVQIIGDIPIYVAYDSADVWANKSLFRLDEEGRPLEVAGVPPDSFSADGQLWGNPLYAWDVMAKDGYAWWMARLRSSFELFDVLRIDHFRGLESYYAVPAADTTARNGQWVQGPGKHFIDAIQSNLPGARIIAEDLGFLTDGVRDLLRHSTYPGMKVLQFAFDSREASDYSPYTYSENSIVYTGTHDNDTLTGWTRTAPQESVRHAMNYVGVRLKWNLARMLIRCAMQTRSALCIIPMQDWLKLGSTARMNTPSTVGGSNWRWRMRSGAASDALTKEMAHYSAIYGRKG